jgi:hypothetical protein
VARNIAAGFVSLLNVNEWEAGRHGLAKLGFVHRVRPASIFFEYEIAGLDATLQIFDDR